MRYLLFLAAFMVAACGQAGAQSDPQTDPINAPIAKQVKAKTPLKTITPNWAIDKTQSHIQFTASQNGDKFTGAFEDYTALIKFDPADLKNSKVKVRIMLGTAETGDNERDEALPGKEWFDIKNFPEAVFETTAFTHLNGDKYEAKAVLTIKGISQDIALPFSLRISDGIAMMSGNITLNRSDYAIGSGMWKSKEWVGHDVMVDIALKASKIQ